MAGLQKSRKWCFTLNNYTDEHLAQLIIYFVDNPEHYVLVGFEKGKKNGKLHLQGFVYFANARRFNSVKSILPDGSHIEQCKGSIRDNYDYCTKDGDFWEHGTEPRMEAPTLKINQFLKQGGTLEDLKIKYPTYYITHAKKIKEFYQENVQMPEVRYLFKMCNKKDDYEDILYKFVEKGHIDICTDVKEYSGQKIVIIDNVCRGYDNYQVLFKWKIGIKTFIKRGFEMVPFVPNLVLYWYEQFNTDDRLDCARDFNIENLSIYIGNNAVQKENTNVPQEDYLPEESTIEESL